MKYHEIPHPCITCCNMRAWSLDKGGDHDFTCKKKSPSEYGKPECDKYRPIWQSVEEWSERMMIKPEIEDVIKYNDPVNHPSHYTQGGIECIDAMVAAFGKEAVRTYCHINAFKYLWRSDYKGKTEDISKAVWYLEKYKELSE